MTERDGTLELPDAVRSDRRAVLVGGGGICLAMILAACGSDPEPSGDGSGGDGGAVASEEPTEETDGETGTGEGTESGEDGLAKVSEIPTNGGKLVGDIMIVKLADGSIKAYNARCTHQGTIVNEPSGDTMTCPQHNSKFKTADGSVTQGPATVALRAVDVKVEGDNVVRA